MADQDRLRELRDASGVALPDALAEHGVVLDRVLESGRQLESAAAYLELHIEQGPVLESLDLPLGAVLGTFGVERHRVTFRGQAAHAGSTPMADRRDALAGAARLELEIREIARSTGDGAVCTMGAVITKPGIFTAVVEEAACLLDQRHLDADRLAGMLADAKAASERFAEEERIDVAWERVWGIEPILFDETLVGLCSESIEEVAGTLHRLPSGPLHDAAEVCRAGCPDGHALRPEPPRPLPHEARGHARGAPRALRAGARPPRVQDDRLGGRRRRTLVPRPRAAQAGRAAAALGLARGNRR